MYKVDIDILLYQKGIHQKEMKKAGMVAQACDPSTQQAEAGRPGMLHSKTLSQINPPVNQ
jgi:hypothetical protein